MSVQGQGSVSAVLDAIRTITRMIRSGSLVGPHTHTARKGGPIQTDTTMRFRNALQPMFDSDSQMLNTNLNADLWRGQRYYNQVSKPKYAAKGDLAWDGSSFWVWNGTKWIANQTAFPNENANLIFAGPGSGAAAAPSFRALVAGDIPGLPASIITSGVLPVGFGGTGASAFTAGSVIFSNGTILTQNNAALFWDDTNKFLGIGTNAPITPLQIVGPTGLDPLRIHANGASRTGLVLNATAGQQALLTFYDGGIEKFQFYKQTDNSFGIYDNVTTASPIVIAPTGNPDYPVTPAILFDNASVGYKVGIGTNAPGAQLNVKSAVEIFQTATLTAGSIGSLIVPYDTVATETDAKGGNLNGAVVVNNADSKIYVRTGGAWKGVAVAGFSIPNYSAQGGVDETLCPICHVQMKPGDGLGMYADKWYNGRDSADGLHAVACHLKCPASANGTT